MVEVLITMVVLMIGIMVVIQMFPSGFDLLKYARSRTSAMGIAQQNLEDWKQKSSNLPQAIVSIDFNGTIVISNDNGVYKNEYPGPPFQTFIDVDGNGVFDAADQTSDGSFIRGNVLNNTYVMGETTAIPSESYFETASGTMYGSRYTLAMGPVDTYRDAAGAAQNFVVTSGYLNRQSSDSNVWPPVLRASDYAINYGGTGSAVLVAFPVSGAGHDYYITYSYWVSVDEGGGAFRLDRRTRVDQKISLDPGYDGRWLNLDFTSIPLAAGESLVQIDRYSDNCARGFSEISPGSDATVTWSSTNPYEFALVDPIMGVVAFNPLGHGMYEYTSTGRRPITARISYRLYDPRIMREDKVIPAPGSAGGEIVVQLALRQILGAGEPGVIGDGTPTDNPDEPTFEGLMRSKTVNIGGQDVVVPQLGIPPSTTNMLIENSIVIIDTATGLWVPVPAMSRQDYINGVVRLPLVSDLTDYYGNVRSGGVSLVGRRLRFLYRADGDWAIINSKSYSTYQRDPMAPGTTIDAPVAYNQYSQVTGDTRDYLGSRLLFSQMYAGQTVAVDYTYILGGVEYKMSGESHRVSTDTIRIPGDLANRGNSFIDLSLPAGATVSRVYAVVGISLRVRVVWRDGKLWRHVDVDGQGIRSPQ